MRRFHRVPPSPCPLCGIIMTAADSLSSLEAVPRPGNVTVCSECGGLFIFDERMHMRLLWRHEVERLLHYPRVVRELATNQQAV